MDRVDPVTWEKPQPKDSVMMQPQTPPVTWRPTDPRDTEMFRFAQWVTTQRGVDLGSLTDDAGNVSEQLYRNLHA